MPSGPIIDGQEVLAAGTYVVRDALNLPVVPGGPGSLCLIGAFPSLEKDRVYSFTSKNTLDKFASPGDTSMLNLSKFIYRPGLVNQGEPARVDLVNITPTTQASAPLPISHNTPALYPIVRSKVWGPRGNTSFLRIAPKASTRSFIATVGNSGSTQQIDAPGVANAITIDYNFTPPPSPPTGALGFGTYGGGVGTVFAEVDTSNDLYIRFTRSLTGVHVNPAGASWTPLGAVTGTLNFTVLAGSSTTANQLDITVVGTDATGLPQTELISIAPDAPPNWTVNVSASTVLAFATVDSVTIVTDIPGTFTGTINVDGVNYVNDTSKPVTDVIAEVNALPGGFSASTGTPYPSRIDAKLLDWTPAPVQTPATISAHMWSIYWTVNNQGAYVELDVSSALMARPIAPWDNTTTYAVGDLVEYDWVWYTCTAVNTGAQPDLNPALWSEIPWILASCTGGGMSVPTTASWQSALDSILAHNVDSKVLMTDDDTIIKAFIQHLDDCWGTYQTPCTGFIGVPQGLSFSALETLASSYNSERIQRCFEAPTLTNVNGSTSEYPPYYLAMMLAAAVAGGRGRSYDRWAPNVVSLYRAPALDNTAANDSIIRLGYSVFWGVGQQSKKLLLECTGWITDNNPVRFQALALRSAVDVHRFIKATLDDAVSAAGSVDGLRGSLVSIVFGALYELKEADVIVDFRDVEVFERDTYFEAAFKYQPRGTKSFILVTATAALTLVGQQLQA